MKNIPKEFLVKVLKTIYQDNISLPFHNISSNGKPIVVIDLFDWRFSNQARINHQLDRYTLQRFGGTVNSSDLIKRKISNSGFKISLFPGFHRAGTLLELTHEDFSDLDYQPAILVNNLSDCLKKSIGCLDNWKFPGNYKIEIINQGYYHNYSIINEELINNPVIDLSIKIADSLSLGSKKRRNSELTPGYFYCLNNREAFLCLGKIKNTTVYRNGYGYKSPLSIYNLGRLFESPYTLFFNDKKEKEVIESGYLILRITTEETIDYLLNYERKPVNLYQLIYNMPKEILMRSLSYFSDIGCIDKLLATKIDGRQAILLEPTENPVETVKDVISYLLKSKDIRLDVSVDTLSVYLCFEELIDEEIFEKILTTIAKRYDYLITSLKNLSMFGSDSEKLVDFIYDTDEEIKSIGNYLGQQLSSLRSFCQGNHGYKLKPLTKDDLRKIIA